MQTLGKVFAAALAIASFVSPAQSAYILGNPGWEPLTLDYLKAHNIDPSFMDEVLDGGGEFTCTTKKTNGHRSMTHLSAWFLNGDTTHIVTNAHLIYSDLDGKLRTYGECHFASNRDVASISQYSSFPIDMAFEEISIGGPEPVGDQVSQDRALFRLTYGTPRWVGKPNLKVVSLKLRPDLVNEMLSNPDHANGTEIFMVASARNAHRDPSITNIPPRIQRGYVHSVDVRPRQDGQPAVLIINADWHFGDSASMVFMRVPEHQAVLFPVGLFKGGADLDIDGKQLDGRPFDPATNNGLAILIDGNFLKFEKRAVDIPISTLPPLRLVPILR